MTLAAHLPTNTRRSHAESLRILHARRIELGTSRSIATETHATLPVIEIEVKREDIPNEQSFRSIVEQCRSSVVWRVTLDDLHVSKTFEATDWQLFVSLVEGFQPAHRIVLHLDRSIRYSNDVLDKIEAFRDTASVPLWLDTEHISWKSDGNQRILKSLRLPHVYLDGQHLPGIVKDVSYYAGTHAILRCIGRNPALWFEHSNERRFAYTYSTAELQEITGRIRKLREQYETVTVLFCNRPAASAVQNVHLLSQLLNE